MKRALLFLMLFSQATLASDFIFSVPVQLDRLPKGIPQAKVLCEVFTYRDAKNPIASGYSIRSIDSRQGMLVDEIPVNVNFHAMQRHQQPHQYRCQLQLLVPWTQPTWQTPNADAAVNDLRPRDNSQLVTEVSGLINN